MRIVIPADRPKHVMAVKDGAMATLSPVLKTDREFFERALEQLSIESRFARFGLGMSTLTNRELEYLTDVDQLRHVAWGALLGDEAAGVGRYIVPDGGGCAELAITVLDAMQRHGIGRALFDALAAVARADGVEELCFEARSDNEAVKRVIAELEVRPLLSGDVIERRIRVSDLPATEHDEAFCSVINEVRGLRRSVD